jgi:hypothetical protein
MNQEELKSFMFEKIVRKHIPNIKRVTYDEGDACVNVYIKRENLEFAHNFDGPKISYLKSYNYLGGEVWDELTTELEYMARTLSTESIPDEIRFEIFLV